MFLFAVSIHVGLQGGGDLTRRWILESEATDVSVIPTPPDTDDDELPMMGSAADLRASPNNINSYAKTSWAPKIAGSFYGGVSFSPYKNIFLQLNTHIGSTGLNEIYYSMPLYGEIECTGGIHLTKRILVGFSSGVSLVAYQTHKVMVKMETKGHINGHYEILHPLKKFENLSCGIRYFIGPFIGIDIAPNIRVIGKLHAAPFFNKKEKTDNHYLLAQEKLTTPPTEIKAQHTLTYGGVRAMLGIEWIKHFNNL